MCASAEGHTEVVQALLQAGAGNDLQTEKIWTALMFASSRGHTEVVESLLAVVVVVGGRRVGARF